MGWQQAVGDDASMQHVLGGILRMGGFGSEDRECSAPAPGKKGGPVGFLEPWRHAGYTGSREPSGSGGARRRPGLGKGIL